MTDGTKALFAVPAEELKQQVLDRWMPFELHGYEQMGPDGKAARDALDELVIRADSRSDDHGYQLERAGILSTAVGLARLYLREGNAEAATEALDTASRQTRELLERLLPLFDTDRIALPEETPSDV